LHAEKGIKKFIQGSFLAPKWKLSY